MSNKVYICLVDDDREDQEIFLEALAKITTPVELTIFDNAPELLNSLKTSLKLPDMLFLDLYLPVLDGEKCLVIIRNDPHFRSVPIIMYSAEYDIDRIENLFHLGANRYLRKPDSLDSLVQSLDVAVKSVRRNPHGSITEVNIIH